MKTTLITLAAILAAVATAHAQIDVSNIKSITVNKSASNAAVTGTREIGRSSLECVYKAVAPERGNEQEPVRMKEDHMILQTGGAVSKFYSYYNFAKDSLLKADPNNALKAVEHKNGTAAGTYRRQRREPPDHKRRKQQREYLAEDICHKGYRCQLGRHLRPHRGLAHRCDEYRRE